jgi:hypothetical protein
MGTLVIYVNWLRILPAAPLAVRRRYLVWCPGRCLVARRRCLMVVPRPLPAEPPVARCRYFIVVPRL